MQGRNCCSTRGHLSAWRTTSGDFILMLTQLLSCVGHGHDTGADLNRVVELDENYTRGHLSAWS